jgi:hypothetical protein
MNWEALVYYGIVGEAIYLAALGLLLITKGIIKSIERGAN